MVTGSCLCGTVRWKMEGPYERMSHCHCSMCRKSHAAPFATYIVVARDRFAFVAFHVVKKPEESKAVG